MTLDYLIISAPEVTAGSFANQRISVAIFDRVGKNGMVKFGASEAYIPINNSYSGYQVSLNNPTPGQTYDIYYKDDEVPEVKLGQTRVTPVNEYCHVNTSNIQQIGIRRRTSGETVISWLNGVGRDEGKYSVSIDGGSTWLPFPNDNGSNSTTFPNQSTPVFINSVIVRRTDIACQFVPLSNIREVPIPQLATCELSWQTPFFTKANESGPSANDGFIRLNANVTNATGTPQYQLLDQNNNVIKPFQVSSDFVVAPGVYKGQVKDDICTIDSPGTVSVLEYVSSPAQGSPSRSRDYINEPNFSRFYYTYGMTLDDFRNIFDGELPPPSDKVVDIEEIESASVRVTTSGDTRITTQGDRRVI